MKNKICVYAIAKNEEKNVERWYNSMKEADLIVVLDTGSTDNTVQLLRSFGVVVEQKIYDHFEFDVARNDSLALVPDEYNIRICTDLDEWLDSGWAEVLRNEWNEERHSRGLYPYVHDHLDDGSEGSIFMQDKIHGKTGKWIYPIHECFYDENYTQERTIIFDDRIKLHHGADITKNRDFYIDLLYQRIENNSLDSNAYFLLGAEYYAREMNEKAIEIYNYILSTPELQYDNIVLACIFCHMGECQERIGNYVEAIRYYSQGILVDMEFRENYYCLAKLYASLGLNVAAIGVAEQGLKSSARKYHWAEGVFCWAWGLYDILRHAYYAEGNYQKALSYAAAALQAEPNNPSLLEEYSLCLSAFCS